MLSVGSAEIIGDFRPLVRFDLNCFSTVRKDFAVCIALQPHFSESLLEAQATSNTQVWVFSAAQREKPLGASRDIRSRRIVITVCNQLSP